MTAHWQDAKRYFTLDFGSADLCVHQLEVINYNDWYAQDVHIYCPSDARAYLPKLIDARLTFLFVPVEGNPTLLLKFAALQAFRGLTVAHLGNLVKLLKVKFAGPRPSNEYPFTMMLLKHVLGA